MSGSRSHRKGKQWERECARELSAALGVSVQRRLDETREGNAGDLLIPGVPLVVQCKVGKRPPIYKALAQAQEVAGEEDVPAAMIRRNGSGRRPSEDFVVLPLEDFLKIAEKIWSTVGISPPDPEF